MTPQTMFYAEFIAANGKRRYVGEGAMMPWTKEEAKLFATKAEAAGAAKRVAPHHRADNKARIGSRKVIISKPRYMTELGL